MRPQNTPSSFQWEMKRHLTTAMSKKVAKAFSLSLGTPGTVEGVLNLSFAGSFSSITALLLLLKDEQILAKFCSDRQWTRQSKGMEPLKVREDEKDQPGKIYRPGRRGIQLPGCNGL